MRLFTTLFEIVKLPLVVAKDVVMVIPHTSIGQEPFSDTREQCEKIDEELSG